MENFADSVCWQLQKESAEKEKQRLKDIFNMMLQNALDKQH